MSRLERSGDGEAPIAAWLVADYPDDAEVPVSYETIYRPLFVQARGALRRPSGQIV